jgi:hypothetical protein
MITPLPVIETKKAAGLRPVRGRLSVRSQGREKPTRRRGLLALALAGLCGCSSTWDEVTSRDFFSNLSAPKDPLQVATSGTDADRRADALRSLKEPKQHGGSDEQQKQVFDLLHKTATTDRHPRCRWAAIQTLGRFKDPAAVRAIEAAYDQAGGPSADGKVVQSGYMPRSGAFQPGQVSTLRCQALTSLGETGDPQAIDFLVRVLRQPPVEGTEDERKMTLDEKMHAARALGKFKGDPRVTEALLGVLKDERDIALRNCAHDSLQQLTGKRLAIDFKAWDEELHKDAKPEQ